MARLPLTEKEYQQRIANVEKIAAARRAQTHCKNGHEFTEETTYRKPGLNTRQCKICLREYGFEYRAAQRRLLKAARIVLFYDRH